MDYDSMRHMQGRSRSLGVTCTPYGQSDLRRRMKEKEEYEEQLRRQEELQRQQEYEALRRRDSKKNSKKNRRTFSSRTPKKGGKRSKLRTILTVLIILVLLAATSGIAVFAMGVSAVSKMQDCDIDKNNLDINSTVASQLDGYRNIAVLGIDARDMSDDSDARSDSIIIVSINEETDEMNLFSVYRDTMVDIDGNCTLDKITHAYMYGGAQQTLQVLNRNLDLNIDEVVVVNWKSVKDAIDAVGGVTVNVKDYEINELNTYIPNTAKHTDGDDTLVENIGKQKLNGTQAVTYARIRKGCGDDFERNDRMKVVFKQTFRKAKKAGIFTLLKIANNVFPETRSNLSTADVLGLALHLHKYKMDSSTTGFPYEKADYSGSAYFLAPKNLADNVSKLHEDFFGQKNYSPTDTVYNISDNICYLTGIY